MRARGPAQVVEELRLRELAGDGRALIKWMKMISPELGEYYHLLALADLLARSNRGGVRACASKPIRRGGSTLLRHHMARFIWCHPRATVILASHSQEAAEAHVAEVLRLCRRANVALRPDQQRAGRFVTQTGASVIACGIAAGGSTGFGADLLCVDDAFSGRLDASSEAVQQATYDAFCGTLLSRCEPGASVILMGARWCDGDLHGRLLSDPTLGWESLNISCRDAAGHSIWPERWSDAALAEEERALGSWEAAALLYGTPRPRGSTMFGAPKVYDPAEVPKMLSDRTARIFCGVDPSIGLKHTNDWSAVVVLALRGRGANTEALLLDAWRGRLELDALVAQIRKMAVQHGASHVIAESVQAQRWLPQAIRAADRHGTLRVIESIPKGDKVHRATALSHAITDGRFRVGATCPHWYLEELSQFPTGRWDDACDATSMAFNVFGLAPTPAEPGGRRFHFDNRAPGLPFG